MPTQREIRDRRDRIQELESQGITSHVDIARLLTISAKTVQRDLMEMDTLWQAQEASIWLRDRHKRRQVAKAESRYRELPAEWQRSKLNKEKERAKEKEVAVEGGTAKRLETQADSEGRLGDVAYMREMRENDKH